MAKAPQLLARTDTFTVNIFVQTAQRVHEILDGLNTHFGYFVKSCSTPTNSDSGKKKDVNTSCARRVSSWAETNTVVLQIFGEV